MKFFTAFAFLLVIALQVPVALAGSLHDAAKSGDLGKVKSLISSGVDINAADQEGNTPLHLAIEGQHSGIVGYLLLKGANQDVLNKKGLSPMMMEEHRRSQVVKPDYALHNAIQDGKLKEAKKIISSGNMINTRRDDGLAPLHIAALEGHIEIIELLLEKGADPNITISGQEETPLDMAGFTGHAEVASLLIRRGAILNSYRPLFIALEEGNIDVAKVLFASGLNIDETFSHDDSEPNFFTLLHYAAMSAPPSSIKFLISQGLNVDVRDSRGQTSLHYAARNGQEAIAEALISEGANVGAKDNDGLPPITEAIEGQQAAVAKILIAHEANVNARTKYAGTLLEAAANLGDYKTVKVLIDAGARMRGALHSAAGSSLGPEASHVKIVELLLASGIDVNIKNEDGDTALHVALRGGHFGVVEHLIGPAKANVNASNAKGETPLFSAAGNHVKKTKALVRHGANINATDNVGNTPLHAAIIANASNGPAEFLVSMGANVNAQNNEGVAPLHHAAAGKFLYDRDTHLDIGKILIANGADVNMLSEIAGVPLTQAAVVNNVEFAKLLLANGAKPNGVSKRMRTPAYHARENGNHDLARMLEAASR